ncbi:hypothetical protein [Kineococcus gypseus]|uniref:hypothetical protein n=1 Tax=Kineococcus gypseus TaxID=1637102 RepID=UPI003D7DDFEB
MLPGPDREPARTAVVTGGAPPRRWFDPWGTATGAVLRAARHRSPLLPRALLVEAVARLVLLAALLAVSAWALLTAPAAGQRAADATRRHPPAVELVAAHVERLPAHRAPGGRLGAPRWLVAYAWEGGAVRREVFPEQLTAAGAPRSGRTGDVVLLRVDPADGALAHEPVTPWRARDAAVTSRILLVVLLTGAHLVLLLLLAGAVQRRRASAWERDWLAVDPGRPAGGGTWR